MKNDMIYLVLALITGALIPVQAATNAVFSKSSGNPLITGLNGFYSRVDRNAGICFSFKASLPTKQQLVAAPAYSYLGGAIVATYVVMITILTPRIGVGVAIGFIVTGQILCAVIIDHFGLFNVAVRTLTTTRVAGIVLMIAGVYCVMRK
jgi:transporter family-2 protein